MPREIRALEISDISTFTKALRQGLMDQETLPSHASMLTLVSKAAGYTNYQQLKAAKPAPSRPGQNKRLERARRVFDDGGIMWRWPKQTAVQNLCLWTFWAALPARTELSEQDVNDMLNAKHSFGDHALLRRSLIDHRMVKRTVDGKIYERIEQAPPADALTLMAAL